MCRRLRTALLLTGVAIATFTCGDQPKDLRVIYFGNSFLEIPGMAELRSKMSFRSLRPERLPLTVHEMPHK